MEAENIAIRIDLGSGQFWDIKPVQTYGMRKQIKKQAQAALTETMRMEQSKDGTSVELLDMMNLTEQVETQTLLVCSVGWSWPEAISVATLENREAWMLDEVLKRMNSLYSRTPEQIKALEKN